MLSPASLRICCLAVMAPALTKAVSQAESFNLPHLPYLLDISILPCPLQNKENTKNISSNLLNDKDIVGSKQIKAPSNIKINDSLVSNYGLWLKKSSKHNSWLEDIIKHLAVNESPEHHNFLQGHKYKENWDCEGESCGGVGVCVGRPTTKTCNSEGTMNKDIPVSQDRMGLLNANTSLDCDFKTKISIDRQSASPTDLSIMSPKELGHLSDIPFSDIQDTMDHPLTPPASRPGSEPAVGGSSTTSNSVCTSEIQEAKSNHITLRRRAEHLMSKLRKLQGKQCELHISGQLKAFLSHQQKSLGIHCQRQQRHNSYRRTKDSVDLKAELLQSEDVRNLSTAALVNLVRKLESSHASGKFLQSHKSSIVSSYGECHFNEKDKVIVKINVEECSEINRASGTLLSNLRHLESAVDSDVTESSSGGESCDEFDGYEEKKIQHPPPVQKRAMWKWSVDRAAVASRWTWLQAQVSDLEYRIRQQNEIYRQLRATKGSVSLEQIPSLDSSTLPTSLEGISCQGIGSNQVVAKHPKTVNGFLDRGSVTSNGYHTVRSVPPSPDQCLDFQLKQQQQFVPAELNSCQTSRTRPLKSSFRKRKLLRTTGLHLVSRRAARLSTVRCSCNCQCDMLPCALCGGRYNNTQSVDPDMMPLLERIALLDPAFHPVLSFEQDISLPLHFETLLKKSELYHYSSRAGPSIQKKPRLAVNSKGLSDQARKHSRKLARNAAQTLLSSAKYRKKHGGRKPDTKHFSKRGGILSKLRRKYAESDISLEALKKAQERHRRLSAASSGSSKPDSPVPSPSSLCSDGGGNGILFNSLSAQGCGRSGSLQELMKKRRGDNAFDINNIVIPYSIASATRVEKLQYKEILTPKWRVIEDPALSGDENGTPKSEDEEIEEDASEEAVSRRHQKCEEDEKKRFVSHLHLPSHSRIRFRGSRYDYRADSSGANTPDPLSPYHPDIMIQDSNSIITGGPSSPALSPPATPIPISAFSDDSQPSGSLIPAPRSERKRTTSLSKRDRPVEDVIKIPEKEQVYAPPYDSRIFPLLDDEFEEMLKTSPHLEIFDLTSAVEELSPKDPSSPASLLSSTSASSVLDDEMADPEWTVVSREKGPEQTLVLKLAKRYQAPQVKHRTININ